jgi:hypothetical protein
MRTVARLYDNYADASRVVTDLETSGISHSDISLVANQDAHGRYAGTSTTGTATESITGGGTAAADPARADDTGSEAGAKRGALTGGLVGGGAGLLAGIGALAIPGVGPVVAAGWLVATLTGMAVGAAGGGLVGALTGAGVSHEEATVYNEGVTRGGTLVTVRLTNEADASGVEAIMQQRHPVDWRTHRAAAVSGSTATTPATTAATTTSDVLPSRVPPQ